MPTKAAYNTKVDFIETPSQLLEEWMWDRDILKMVSHHYQTEKPLPDSIINGLIKTRNITDAAHDTTGCNSDHEGQLISRPDIRTSKMPIFLKVYPVHFSLGLTPMTMKE